MDKLATIQQQTQAITADPYAPTSFDQAMSLAESVAKSRLFGITTKEDALMRMATGHELGLSSMQSLRVIHNIEGKLSPSADAVHAIVLNSGLAEYFREVETTDTHSTWETKRKGCKPVSYTFTMEDAGRAKLIKPAGNWEKHPQRMMRARAKTFLARDVYPDLLLGLYIPDELAENARPATVKVIEAIDAAGESIPQPEPVRTVDLDDPVAQLEQAIGSASNEELPALANRVRELCPKGHPMRERLATALTIRKGEVSRAA